MSGRGVKTKLFFSFAKVGLFTIGGGYAMLPMLEREIVEKHGWATPEQMLDYYAIGQATPGVIAVNVASFVGYRQAKFAGTIAATLGIALPSFIIICLLAGCIDEYRHNPLVHKALAGIRISVAVMVLFQLVKVGKKAVTSLTGLSLAVLGLAVMSLRLFSPVIFIAIVLAHALFIEFRRRKKI